MYAVEVTKNWYRSFQEARKKKTLLSRIREFRAQVEILHESPEFIVTTAARGPELLKALQLRHDIFIEEWQGRRAYHQLDVDEFDFVADHLLISEKKSGDVIGTYRLLSSHFTSEFYSRGEFTLDQFLTSPGIKLEMGRACIRKDHRNGGTIDLLWKGLSQYIEVTKTDFLFGCSSIKSMDVGAISRLYRTLAAQSQWSDEHFIRATDEYRFPGFQPAMASDLTPVEKRELIPPLLRSYLHAGAKVYGTPARDLEFGCTDLLTILDWKNLSPRFQSRYLVATSP